MLKIFLLIILILINTTSSADECAEIAQKTGGICIVPPIADQTDPDWEKMFVNVVLNALISSIQPSIITVTPNQLPQGGTANFTLTASKTHFNASSQIDIGGGITIDITKVESDTEMLLNVTAPVNTTPDYYDITVNTGVETATGIGVLRITPASNSPKILSIYPAILAKNSTIEMQIYGNQTNFTENSIVKFATKQADNSFIEDSGINAQIKTVTPNLLTITANVTATASTGLHNITVITDAEKAIDNNELGSLRINERDSDFAEITSITPNNASQGDTININIAGSNVEFINNKSAVKFGDTGIEVLSTTVTSPTQATAEIKIADNALLGTRDVYITTGTEVAKKLAGFAIFSPASINLNTNQGQQGNNVQLMITGDRTNFAPGVTQINFGGNGVTASTITVINKTTIVATIQITNDAEPTTRDISIVTGEEVVALLSGFTVTAQSEIIIEEPKVIPSVIELTEKIKEVPETGEIIITVKRTDGKNDKVTVNYTIIDGTAKAGEDFTAIDGTLTWEDGDDKEITISILDDENVEENETFTLKLTSVTGNASLGLSEVEITILNDDVVVAQPTDLNTDEPEVDNTESDDNENIVDSIADITDNTDSNNVDTGEIPDNADTIDNDSSTIDSEEFDTTDSTDDYFSDIPITTEPIVHPPQPTPPKPCPESDEIHTYCTFQWRNIENVFIAENASVSNAILTGNMENYGLASNLIIEENATLTGGNVTGYIQNKGTMADFTFIGASISGGTLQGEITNDSKMHGYFENIYLAPNTTITRGQLRGYIIGIDPNNKPILQYLTIRKGSFLVNVKIGKGVIMDEERIFIDQSVEFIY